MRSFKTLEGRIKVGKAKDEVGETEKKKTRDESLTHRPTEIENMSKEIVSPPKEPEPIIPFPQRMRKGKLD